MSGRPTQLYCHRAWLTIDTHADTLGKKKVEQFDTVSELYYNMDFYFL